MNNNIWAFVNDFDIERSFEEDILVIVIIIVFSYVIFHDLSLFVGSCTLFIMDLHFFESISISFLEIGSLGGPNLFFLLFSKLFLMSSLSESVTEFGISMSEISESEYLGWSVDAFEGHGDIGGDYSACLDILALK